jgi:hypothetical protein
MGEFLRKSERGKENSRSKRSKRAREMSRKDDGGNLAEVEI